MRSSIQILLYFLLVSSAYSQYELDKKVVSTAVVINQDKINTSGSEFGPFSYVDFVGFVYSNDKNSVDKRINENYFDLAFSAQGIDNNLVKKANFRSAINKEWHEGPGAYDKVNNLFYFSRAEIMEAKIGLVDTFVNKLYVSDERFSEDTPQLCPMSSDKYSVMHPTLNLRGDEIIVASDHSISLGGFDIMKTKPRSSELISIEGINTSYNEVFPSLIKDSILVFASDRPNGFGGLDLYYSVYYDGLWSSPLLLPAPFNSKYDDFGFLYQEAEGVVFISSNRVGGKGKDDIYLVDLKGPLFKKRVEFLKQSFSFSLIDKLSIQAVPDHPITISSINLDALSKNEYQMLLIKEANEDGVLMKIPSEKLMLWYQGTTSGLGSLNIDLDPNQTYILTSPSTEKYEESYFVFSPDSKESDITLILNPKVNANVVEEELPIIPLEKNKVVVFNNIYYERNSAAILEGASNELDVLFKAMVENPNMIIELSAHTDSRGTKEYNNKLSLERATSAKNYLINLGIESKRIKAIGLGESRIRNHCLDNIQCSEEEHKYNRRTEVKILEI